MPQYPNLVIDADLSISGVGQLSNARIQNVTSAGRLTLEQELVTSEAAGNTHTGQIIFDVDLQTLFIFVSANSQFEPVSFNREGDVMFKGVINPSNANSNNSGTSGGGTSGTDSSSGVDSGSNGGTTTTTADIITNSSNASLLIDASSTADGSVIDGSSNSHAITVNGDVTQSSFSPYRSGGYSWQFNGQGNYITKTNSNNAPEFNFVGEDFTVEFWMNLNGSNHSNNPVIMGGQQGWYVQLKNTDSRITFYDNAVEHHADVTLDNSEWYHVAVSRSGSTLKTFLNGTQVYSGSSADGRLYGSDFIIASYSTATQLAYNGFLSDIRVVKGTALYTESFTPPTERLTEVAGTSLLTCNKPYLQSGLTITGDVPMVAKGPYDYVGYSESLHGGSYVFDGNGDYLEVPNASSEVGFDFGTEPFTWEGWFNSKDFSGDHYLISFQTSDGDAGHMGINVYQNGWRAGAFNQYLIGDHLQSVPVTTKTNTWTHFALVREGTGSGQTKFYVNGSMIGSTTISANLNCNGLMRIGRHANGTGHFNGNISDIRIVKGTAVYTEDFIPSTAPLEAVTGTSLLLSGNNAEVRDETQSVESISIFGNTTVVEDSPYGAGKSMSFDGNGDYLSFPALTSLSGDFAIETWVYPTDLSSNRMIFEGRPSNSSAGNYITLQWHTSRGLGLYHDGWKIESGTNELVTNQWQHVALIRSGTSIKLFINGTQVGNTYTSSTEFLMNGSNQIGALYSLSSTWWQGKIADFRIVDGDAIYTANFDVPTAPLGDYSETTTTTSSGSGDTDSGGTTTTTTDQYYIVGSFGDDDADTDSGSVFVYDATDLSAAPTQLLHPNPAYRDFFGSTSASNSDKFVIVAYGDNEFAGSIFVYDKTDLSAAPVELTTPDAADWDLLGTYDIAMSDTHILAGTYGDDDVASNAGSAYLWDLSDLSASPTKLQPSNLVSESNFGFNVALGDNHAIVAAKQTADTPSGYTDPGAIYIYDLSDLSATPTELMSPEQGDSIGASFGVGQGGSIGVLGNTLVVGAHTLTVDGNGYTGKVYLYDLSDLSAAPTELTNSIGESRFGYSVDITDTHIAVGAPWSPEGSANGVRQIGAAYVYDRSDLSAAPAVVYGADQTGYPKFGWTVRLSDTTIMVGARGETFINADNTIEGAAGATYIWSLSDLTGDGTKLTSPNPDANDRYGTAVEILTTETTTSSGTGAGTDSTSSGIDSSTVDTSGGGVLAFSGFQYVVDTAGTLVRDGVTFIPSGQVEVGDIVLFTSETEAYVIQSNVSPATTTKAGTINLATQAAVDAGVIDSDAVTVATLAGSQLAAQVALNTSAQNVNATDIANLQTFTGEGTALSSTATDLAAAINELVGRADSSATEIDGLETLVGEGTILSTAATSLAAGLNELVGRQDSSDAALIATEADIASLQAFTGEGTTLDTTAADLAAAINELHGEIVTNASEIAANTADIAPTTASILTNTNEIVANDSDLAALNTRLDEIDVDLSGVNDTITSLYTQIASNDADIATIVSTFGSNDTELANLAARMLTAEGNITGNDSDILALQTRMTSFEGNTSANDSDLLANAALISSLETYFGSDSLNTSAITLAGAINELHSDADTNAAAILGNDSDILGLQTLFGSGPLSTTATTLAGAINELQGEITANDSDIAVLTGQISTVESQDDIKAYNQDNITFVADVEQTINHNLGLEFITGFTIAVMDGTGDMIEATIRALDSNSIGIMTEFDVSNASMFMLANLSAPAQGDIPPGTVMTQSGGYVVTQGGVYVVLNGYTGGGTSTESGTDSSSPAPAPAPEPEPEPEPEAVVISNSSEVTLLLDASVSGDDTVIDDSPSAHSVTVNGDVTQSSFSPYRSGGYSQEFSTGYISKTADDDSFNFGSDDFTVEMWFNAGPQAANYPGLFSGSNYNVEGSASFRFDNLNYDQKVWLYINGVGDPAIVTTNTYEYYQWHHTALVRNGTDLSIYVNGVQDASITISASQNINFDAGEFRMGRGFDVDGGNGYFNGKIAGVRAVRGTAVYTSNFTVPTSSPTDIAGTELLTCHLPYVVDGSSNNHGLTLNGGVSSAGSTPYDRTGYSESLHGGSIVFDGNGDYLSMSASSDFDFGSSDFTIEAWVNVDLDSINYNLPLVGWGNGSYKIIRLNSSGINVESPNPSNATFNVSFPSSPNTRVWNHIALVRSGNTFTAYLNGKGGTAYTSFTGSVGNSSDSLRIGYKSDPAYYPGRLSDLRIVKGTAVYTTDFTPPTAPLTAVTGTSLLLAGTNASYRDQTQGVKSMSMEGNVAVESSSPFDGQRSLTFDGSGDRVVMESDALAFGTGDYTVEGWAYLDSVGYYKIIITTRPDNGGYADAFSIQVDNNTGQLFLYSNAFDMKSPSSVPVGQWFHYAVTRENSLTRMFLDGVEVNSGTLTKNYARTLVGVGDFPVTMSEPWVGEIGEIRVTKGLARYTSDFTPPTGPLGEYTEAPNVAPTISGIDASYTLVSGMDTVITGVATDLHNDPVTWSYAVTSGSLGDTTVTQADNVFTITPGTADATFQLTFTATDDNGNASTVASDFTHVYVEPTYTQGGLVLHLDAANPASYSGSGNWIDLTGNGGDATLNNGMAFDAADEGSFTIDGVDDFAQFSTSALVSGNGAFTNEFWFKWDGTAGNQPIFGYGNDVGPNVVNVAVITNNKFRFEFGSGAGITDSTTTINTGTWYHAVATYDQSSIKVYINGVLEATTAYSSANVPLSGYNGENGSIGALFSTWGNVSAGGAKRYGTFGGNVAVVRQYNRALNGTEIQFNYDASKDRYNEAPTISGIDASYTLATGSDTVITGVATDPEGDAITWSYEVISGDLAGTTVSQSDNVFTVSHGFQDANFTLRFKATDSAGNETTHDASFALTYVNQAPTISGIQSSYTLVQGQDTVITAGATDPEGDAVTWSYEEVLSSGSTKTAISSENPNEVHVYDSSDLTGTPTVLSSPDSNDTAFGRGLHSDSDNLYITGLQNGTSPCFYVYDLNDLTATPTVVVPPATSYSSFGTNTFAVHSSQFESVGDKIYISNYESAWGDWDNGTDRGRGKVFVYDKNDWSAAPITLTAIDQPVGTAHPTNTTYYGANFGYAIKIYDSNLYVTRSFGSENSWDTAIFVYNINDLSAAPTLFQVNATSTGGTIADQFGKDLIATADNIFVSAGSSDVIDGSDRGGAVFVYDRSDLTATPTALTAPTPLDNDRFGDVMISTDSYLIVSRYDRGTHAINSMNGLVEVYNIDTLQHVTTISPPAGTIDADNNLGFGATLRASGSTLLIAARSDDVSGLSNVGSVFVYDLNDLTAAPTQILAPNSVESPGYFGSDMTISQASLVSGLAGSTVAQSGNVFTVTPGTADANFQLTFTATDDNGNASTHVSDFTYVHAEPAELVGEPSVSSFSHIPSTRYATPGSPAVTDAATGVDVGRPDTGSSASAMIDVTVEVGTEYEFSFTATTQSGDTMFMGVIPAQGATTPEFGYVGDNALGQYPNTVHNRASVSGSGDSQTIVFTATQTDLQIVMWNSYSENLVNVQFISLKATS